MRFSLFLLVVCLLFLPLGSAALSVTLDVPASFTFSQKLSFYYTLRSDFAQNVMFIPHILCPRAPISLLVEREINVSSEKTYEDTYADFSVDNSIEPQNCTAYIRVLSPIQQTFSKNFSIVTNPSFSFDVKTCADVACQTEKKVFVAGENISLQYAASVQNPVVKAMLTSPDKQVREISLPLSLKAEQIGTYILEVSASKQGYRDVSMKEEFGILEKPAEIKTVNVKDIQTPVELQGKASGETASTEIGNTVTRNYVLIVSLIVVAILIILVILVIVRGRRAQEKSSNSIG